ncbi:MAG: hypothetical protein ACR2PZ_27280 [Pseudomonadales bacterium]
MLILEIALVVILGYVALLLLLEAVIWKTQPNMESGVTLFVNRGNDVVARKLYGFEYGDKLYVSSNHWFRRWYYALLEAPLIDVEHAGEIKPYIAIPIEGSERAEIAREYQMGFILRLLCGFAPRRFLRLDPRELKDGT